MTLQSVRFGALTPRQESLVSRGLPSEWQPIGRRSSLMDVVDLMIEEGDRILDGNELSADTFTPSAAFMEADAALTDYFASVLPDDNASPLEIMRAGSAGSTLPLDQQAAGQILDRLSSTQSCYVSDSLIHALLQVIRG